MSSWPRFSAIAILTLSIISTTTIYAFPIAAPGTEGFVVIADSSDSITATYQGNSASYSNDLLLNGTFIFNNHATPVGTSVSLGNFVPGTELVFELFVHNTGDHFFTGPASRNPDSQLHARAQANWLPGTTLVSFEDLHGGPFAYNDLSFSFTNTTSISPVPIPGTLMLMIVGIGLLGGIAQLRRA